MIIFNKRLWDEEAKIATWFNDSDKDYRYAFTRSSFNAPDLVFRIFTKFDYLTEAGYVERDKQCLEIYLPVSGATSAPPLGTLLSQFGINTIQFCDQYNTSTEIFDQDFTVRVCLTWFFKTRKFNFFLEKPTCTLLIRRMGFFMENIICVKGEDVVRIARFKFVLLKPESSTAVLFGAVNSMRRVSVVNYL